MTSWRERYPDFGLRLTLWGGVFLVAVVVLALAAINTGNNSLMAVLGLALGSYVVSGFWSRQVLGAVSVRVAPPPELVAGRPAVFRVILENRSRWLPAYALRVRDGAGQPLVVEEVLGPRQRREHAVERVFPERGWRQVGPWRLEVLLPLGFFLKSKEVVPDTRVLVYPRLAATGVEPVRSESRQPRQLRTVGRGREGDVSQLRGWRDGDDRRQVHWKQTARQQRPIVVDRQRREDEPVTVVLDTRLEDPDRAVAAEAFEERVRAAATTVVDRLRAGAAVGLVAGRTRVAPVRGLTAAGRLLAVLAVVEPDEEALAAPAPRARRRAEVMAG